MNELFPIIHEDSELLVINKPAGLVCHPTKGDVYSSLISRVRLHLGPDSQPHLINRLDRETSGVILVAKNDDAALELRRLWEQGQVAKHYLAIVHGCPSKMEDVIDAPLGKDFSSAVAIKDTVRADGSPARTGFQVVRTFQRSGRIFSLLHVRPLSGRKHQIRIHLAHYGHSIVGDKLYGADERYYLDLVEGKLTDVQRAELLLPWHALHAQSVVFERRGQMNVHEAIPESWFAQFADTHGNWPNYP